MKNLFFLVEGGDEVVAQYEEACGGLVGLVRVVYRVVRILMIVIPIALIIYGTIDLGRAVIASDEKEVKAAQSRLIKRFIYAALVFFVPTLVAVVMNILSAGTENASDSWSTCWKAARSSKNSNE